MSMLIGPKCIPVDGTLNRGAHRHVLHLACSDTHAHTTARGVGGHAQAISG